MGAAQRWRLSLAASLLLSCHAVSNAGIVGGIAALYWLKPHDWFVAAAGGLYFLRAVMMAGLSLAYVRVSSRAPRPRQLHLHGLAVLTMQAANALGLIAETLRAEGHCAAGFATRLPNLLSWCVAKAVLFLMMRQKMIALGPTTLCSVAAHRWGSALVVSAVMLGLSPAMLYALGVHLVLNGLSCGEALEAQSGESFGAGLHPAVAAVAYFFLATYPVGVVGLVISGTATIFAANRLRRDALSKLVERQVHGGELARVQQILGHHVLGMFVSIASQFVVVASGILDGFHLLGEGNESQEAFIHGLASTVDMAGDAAGILLLSGIGILLMHEDPEAGDISSRIRGILHSAVLTSRAEMAFEGRVEAASAASSAGGSGGGAGVCVASFPGKFLGDWHSMTWACEQGNLCSACVFLPKADPLQRFGKHTMNPQTPGKCWCDHIYGEAKPWGCCWFSAWKANVELAAELELKLVAVFFPGQAGKGIADWDDLGNVNLWDGIGLGGSQKVEVAYMKKHGFHVSEMDLETFRECVRHMSARSRAFHSVH